MSTSTTPPTTSRCGGLSPVS